MACCPIKGYPATADTTKLEQPITRKMLATFIEYAAKGSVTSAEWSRFMVRRYQDERMEEARRQCVRVIQRSKSRRVAKRDLDFLSSVADGLRAKEP
jgi:hypothetical protein